MTKKYLNSLWECGFWVENSAFFPAGRVVLEKGWRSKVRGQVVLEKGKSSKVRGMAV